jgi:ribonuclease Y
MNLPWINLITVLSVSLLLGALLGVFIFRSFRKFILEKAQEDAQEIHAETQNDLEMLRLEQQEKKTEIELELWTKSENDLLKLEEKTEELQNQVDEKKKKIDDRHSVKRQELKDFETQLKESEKSLEQKQKSWENRKLEIKNAQNAILEKIQSHFQLDPQETLLSLVQRLEDETKKRCEKYLEHVDEDLKDNSESIAKNVLDSALDRFIRPYCAERGIGAVQIPDQSFFDALCKPEIAQAIQNACGCDIIVESGQENVGVAGFDPVRRELTRRVLEKLIKNRRDLNAHSIPRLAEQTKNELFKQIQVDGDALAKELRQPDLHPEIKQMMGSLRYRYSFTQNQYFHCGEVGWLAGLLASEIHAHVKDSRRSGLLHDIGKSMDHALDGGHAMIGADFIEKRNEKAHIVHNVRAHHYDVTPNSPEAFIVIAADAISGARPGARRSTMESYTQKVTEIQDIARSFEGVTDCFVLNGGRECRVLVNSRKVNDSQSLEISRKIADRIENECSYPGQIKVVVVRETATSESTLQMNR